ncbi:MAG: metallopeptidase TldD-related protein [Candidatus Kapaibacterium sp.]
MTPFHLRGHLHRLRLIGVVVAVCVGILYPASPASAQPRLPIEELRRALRDEIARSMSELRLAGVASPYYIEYTLRLRQSYTAKASMGSMVSTSSSFTPRLTVGVRVGSPAFDNTNFFDVGLSLFGSSDDEESFRNRRIPMELDYRSLRRELWLASDACYKQAAELYAKKESVVKNRARVDTTHDFVPMPADVTVDTTSSAAYDRKRYEELVLVLSSVFFDAAHVHASSANIEYLPELVIYANSEGREYVKTSTQTGLEIVASTQADDGMPLADVYTVYAPTPAGLPSRDSLLKAARALVDGLSRLRSAPAIEPYSGPVIFESQAACEVFAQTFAPNLCTQRQQLTDRGIQESDRYVAFQNKIGARVAAPFLSVTSSPSRHMVGSTPIVGGYDVDDDGVRPSTLTLVDHGYLKTLLASRVPGRRVKASNGRQRGGAAMIDVLELRADAAKQMDKTRMRKTLMKLLKDRDLPFGYIVRKALNQNILYTTLFAQTQGDYPYSLNETSMNVIDVVRVYADGREETVRGAQAAGLAPSQFKDLVAAGSVQTVYNYLAPAVTSPYVTGGSQYLPATVIVPDLLFEDVEMKPLEGDFPKPPILPPPSAQR